MTYADRELNLATEAFSAAKEALCLDTDAQMDADARMHSAIVQEVMQNVTQMITKELTQDLEGMDKESLLHSMLSKLAGYVATASGPAAPPAAPPQAAKPRHRAPAPAAPSHFRCACGRGDCDASCDESRLPQRVPLKTAAVETPAAYIRRHQDAARLRQDTRASDLDARRADGEVDPRPLLGKD